MLSNTFILWGSHWDKALSGSNIERINLVKRQFAAFVIFEHHIPSPLKISAVLLPSELIFALLIFPAEIESRYLLVHSAATTANACVVLKSHLIHCLHPSRSVFHFAPPSAFFLLQSMC